MPSHRRSHSARTTTTTRRRPRSRDAPSVLDAEAAWLVEVEGVGAIRAFEACDSRLAKPNM